jgi:hypothetical protein
VARTRPTRRLVCRRNSHDGSLHMYLSVVPNWTPELPSQTAGNFTMADLICYAVPGHKAGRNALAFSEGYPLVVTL